MTLETLTWCAIAFCLSQSAIFSGLNLAFFSLSRLQLEVETKNGNANAAKILAMREDANFLLATVLWGNVSINVLLTLLSDSVMLGINSFLFSTVAITFLGEIFPQAYFSRNAMNVASLLSPVIRFYQIVLFPVTRPTAKLLDLWLGKEGITYFREQELRSLIHAHMEAEEAEMEHVEGIGALNFLAIDDVLITEEGETLDPKSVISRPYTLDLPQLPAKGDADFEDFLKQVNASGHKWIVMVDDEQEPLLLMDADGYLRAALLDEALLDPYRFCHRPMVIRDEKTSLGTALKLLKDSQESCNSTDEVLEDDIILVWMDEDRRVITGADILGRLLRGIGANQQRITTANIVDGEITLTATDTEAGPNADAETEPKAGNET